MIRVDGLRKVYGDFAAVVGSTFEVAEGEVFGIVGPNGAGKTTTLKTLAGLIEPTTGTVRIGGRDATETETRRDLGFLPEESPLYEDMTARSYLRFFGDLYDVPRERATARTERTLDRLELDHRDRRLGDTSKGMKRKVAIARSLVNDPSVLVYDEPASGLDPLTTNEVLAFVRELREAGKTVVFSAHNLYHVESVCDRVAVMNEGEIIARGTVEEIRGGHGDVEYHVFTTVPVEGGERVATAPAGPPPAESRTAAEGGAVGGDEGEAVADGAAESEAVADGAAESEAVAGGPAVEDAGDGADPEGGDRYRVVVDDLDGVDAVRERATAAGGAVVDIRSREPSLEDVFLQLTGEPMAGSRHVSGGET